MAATMMLHRSRCYLLKYPTFWMNILREDIAFCASQITPVVYKSTNVESFVPNNKSNYAKQQKKAHQFQRNSSLANSNDGLSTSTNKAAVFNGKSSGSKKEKTSNSLLRMSSLFVKSDGEHSASNPLHKDLKEDFPEEAGVEDGYMKRSPRYGLNDLYMDMMKKGPLGRLSAAEWEGYNSMFVGQSSLEHHWPGRFLAKISALERKEGLLELGQSLYDFIVDRQPEHSTVLHAKASLIQLYVHQHPVASIARGEEGPVRDLYREIRADYEILDATTCGRIIRALYRTSLWRDCFQLLDMIRFTAQPTAGHYSATMAGAASHGQFDLAFKVMADMYEDDLAPTDVAFDGFLDSDDADDGIMNRLLSAVRQFDWIVSEDTVDKLKRWFESKEESSWSGSKIMLQERGSCVACGQPFEPLRLSDAEFNDIQEVFLKNSLANKNVFLRTSPEEVNEFRLFIETYTPFDVVIDGLNVAYSTVKSKKVSNQQRAKLVLQVVEHFAVKKNMKVAMLGRKHMLAWAPKEMEQIQRLANCWFAENISADDTFILHATLASGPRTLLVTRDFLRDHSFLMGSERKRKFRHWQRSHQVSLVGCFTNKRGESYLKFVWPDRHQTNVQRTLFGWHIPYDDGSPRPPVTGPQTWLCLQSKTS